MTDLLTTVSVVFIVAGPVLLVANRFDQPSVPYLIAAGLIAGFFIQDEPLLELAQYGIALLVFTFGVGIQVSDLRPVLVNGEAAGFGQILIVGTLGTLVGLFLNITLIEAVIFGIAAALSSTVVGTALLQTEISRNLLRGRLAESIYFVQDVFAVGVLLVMGAGVLAPVPIAAELLAGLMLLLIAAFCNLYLFNKIELLAGDSDELMIVGTISLLVLFIIASQLVGVSIIVGAFAAGYAVRYDRSRYLGLFNGLESIKDFFIAIFFVTVGALITAPTIEKVLLVGMLVVLTVVVKPVVTTAILLYRGYEARSATLTSLSTDQVSEFSIIIAIEALILGLVTQSLFDAIILAAALTMITSSWTQWYAEGIYRYLHTRGLMPTRHDQINHWSSVPESIEDHVIIVGYGRQGTHIAERLDANNHPYVVIENDPTRRDVLGENAAGYVFGEAMEPYTWEKAAADRSSVIVSTIDSDPVSRYILTLNHEVPVILRAYDRETARDFLDAGAMFVIVADLLAGQRLLQYLQALADKSFHPDTLRTERQKALEAYGRDGSALSISHHDLDE